MCPLHYIFSKDFYLDNKFGKSSGPVWLEKLSCTGTEHDITACLLDWKTQSCSNQSAVGLSCGKHSFLHTSFIFKSTDQFKPIHMRGYAL